jgi:hypothetical protein
MKVTRIAVIASVLSFASAVAYAQEPPQLKDIDADGDGMLNKDGKISAEEYEEALAGCE